jgi:hypothetical protein
MDDDGLHRQPLHDPLQARTLARRTREVRRRQALAAAAPPDLTPLDLAFRSYVARHRVVEREYGESALVASGGRLDRAKEAVERLYAAQVEANARQRAEASAAAWARFAARRAGAAPGRVRVSMAQPGVATRHVHQDDDDAGGWVQPEPGRWLTFGPTPRHR